MVAQRHVVDRRSVLRLGVAGASTLALSRVLSACGGSSSPSSALDGPIDDSMSLVQRWVPDQLGPGVQRLPISLADNAGLLTKGPTELTARVINYLDDSVVADNLVATRRSLGEGSAPFWVFETAIDQPGVYGLVIAGGPSDGASLQVREASPVDLRTAPRYRCARPRNWWCRVPARRYPVSTRPPSAIIAAWNPCAVVYPNRARSTRSR